MRIAAALILLLAGTGAAARLETSADARELRVGDRVTLNVAVSTAPGETLLPFSPPADWGPMELVSASSAGAVHTFVLTTFAVDGATVPALTFRVRDAAGREKTLSTPPLPLTVKSVLPPDAAALKGMKGGQRRPPGYWRPWILAGLGLGALAAAALALRRRRAPAAPTPEQARADAFDDALRALDELESLAGGPAKAYYSRLTDVWRAYVEKRFGLPVLERTTAETAGLLKDLPVPPEDRVPLRDLLDTADLAKFARFESPPEERRRHKDEVRRFVLATRPTADAAEEAPA